MISSLSKIATDEVSPPDPMAAAAAPNGKYSDGLQPVARLECPRLEGGNPPIPNAGRLDGGGVLTIGGMDVADDTGSAKREPCCLNAARLGNSSRSDGARSRVPLEVCATGEGEGPVVRSPPPSLTDAMPSRRDGSDGCEEGKPAVGGVLPVAL